jgi:hypothetical protein
MIPLVRVLVPLLTAAVLIGGCAGNDDDAAPVATMTVTAAQPRPPAGGVVDFTYRFVVAAEAQAFADDYVVFVHFVDADGEQLWTDDHEPPTPVRTWTPGRVIEYQRTMFVPKTSPAGETRIIAGLYAPRTGERLRLAGEPAGQRAYLAGTLTVRPWSDDYAVALTDGWYSVEGGDDGVEWQWSRDEARLAFRNPKRPAELLLQLDQPVQAFPEGQVVALRLGSATVDSFVLRGGRREVRRIRLTPELMGERQMVEMTVTVDKTFVPATLVQPAAGDRRELGVRVFRAFVEPK